MEYFVTLVLLPVWFAYGLYRNICETRRTLTFRATACLRFISLFAYALKEVNRYEIVKL